METYFKIGAISQLSQTSSIKAKRFQHKSKAICGTREDLYFRSSIKMYCEIKNALIYYQIPTKLLDFGVNELGSFTNLQAEQKYEFFCLGNELCFVDRNHSWMIKKNFSRYIILSGPQQRLYLLQELRITYTVHST